MSSTHIAPINMSKLGFRYFRILIESKLFSQKFIQDLIHHPNTGYVFLGTGWSGKKQLLGIGIWAINNAEIADISQHIRAKMPRSYKVVYQSELTRLEYFTKNEHGRIAMVLLDELENKIKLTPLELDYLKLISTDSQLEALEYSALLNINLTETCKIEQKLKQEKILYDLVPNLQLPNGYTKIFVDTTAIAVEQIDILTNKLKQDVNCVYLARGNGLYNLEFEYVITDRQAFKQTYKLLLQRSREVKFTNNLFTNLFPQSKFVNTKLAQNEFKKMIKPNTTYYDLRNSKLWYISHEGAKSYLNVYSNSKYKKSMQAPETELFSEVSANIIDSNNTLYNFIDLGSGDGDKGKALIQALGENNIKSYFPVDIQEIELSQAIKTHEGSLYSIHPTLLDFNTLSSRFPIAKNSRETNIYALLGGTYGNFKHQTINKYLEPLLESPDDYLLISMGIRDKTSKEKILAAYYNNTVETVCSSVLKQIGFKYEDFKSNEEQPKMKAHLQFEDNRVVAYFILKTTVQLFGHIFIAGTQFDILTSWKPTKQEFKNAVEESFTIKYLASNGAFATAICTKKHS